MLLGDVTDPCPNFRRQSPAVAAEQPRRSAIGAKQSQEQSNGGRFSGAVAPQEPKHPAARHRQMEILNSAPAVEVAGQAGRLEGKGFTHDVREWMEVWAQIACGWRVSSKRQAPA